MPKGNLIMTTKPVKIGRDSRTGEFIPVKVAERRAKLLGLDMPTKISATDPSGEKEASFVQFYLPANGRDEEPVNEDDV
jgi:hypothetical protein